MSPSSRSAAHPVPLAAPAWMPWLVWGTVASLYFVAFFQRVAPAVMVDELMREFTIGAALMGNLAAMYFYAYAAAQVPAGILLDWVGPRLVSTVAAVFAGVGMLMFALADSLYVAYAGRLLIGAAVGVAFVACMKLAGHWFPANRFATVTGVALMLGNLGGIVAGVPLAEAVGAFGWRATMVASAMVTFALAVLVWLVVRDDPTERGYASHAHPSVLENGSLSPGQGLRVALANRETWMLFLAAGLSAGPVLVFAGLWGVPYLTQVHGISTSIAATLTSTMLLAWAFGGPGLGAISDRIGRRKRPYLIANAIAAVLWGVFLFGDLPLLALYPLFAAIGLSSGGLIIGYAFAREANHPGASGLVGGVVNMATLGFGAVLQQVLGVTLDRRWDGTVVEGVRVYSAAAYFDAFVWLVGCVALSAAVLLFTRETWCRLRHG
jgi:sugar phosphate permease